MSSCKMHSFQSLFTTLLTSMEAKSMDRPGISATTVWGSLRLARVEIPLESVQRQSWGIGISASLLKKEMKKRAALCKRLAEREEQLFEQLGCSLLDGSIISTRMGYIDPATVLPDMEDPSWETTTFLAVMLEQSLQDSVRVGNSVQFECAERQIENYLAK